MTGYTRQSTSSIVSGEQITAEPLAAEFNALQTAFNASSGHTHTGGTGDAPKIPLATSVSGYLPAANGGSGGKNKTDATTAPTTTDDNTQGYAPGSIWVDVTNDLFYACVDASTSAAVWTSFGGVEFSANAPVTAINALTAAADRVPYYTSSSAAALAVFTSFGRSLVDDADAATARTTLGLGTIATQAASGVSISGGSITGITDLAVADGGTGASTAANARTNLGLAIGSDVQAWDADLDTLAGLAKTDGNFIVGNGSAWVAESGATARASLGLSIGSDVQAYDADLTAIAGLTSAANKVPYYTGSGTAALADFSSFGRSLVDDADAGSARSTLGLVIGTNVQAYDAELAAIAGLTSAADRLPYFTGSGSASLATFTSFGRSLVDDADATTARATLGVRNSSEKYAFSANKSGSDQAITGGVNTKVTFGTELFDVGSYYDTSTSRFTPPAGKYMLNASVDFEACTDSQIVAVYIYKNGSAFRFKVHRGAGTGSQSASVTALVDANGTDYFEVYAINHASTNIQGETTFTYFEGYEI